MAKVKELKKEVCQCHNPECGKTFKSSEIKHTYRNSYGVRIANNVCPHCESNTYGFGLVNYPVKEEKLIYNNSNGNSELVKHLDQITNEIIKDDMRLLGNKEVKSKQKTLQQKWNEILKNDQYIEYKMIHNKYVTIT